MQSDKIKRFVLDALLLAVALIFSYVEAILPLNIFLPLPAFKLGLANVVIMLAVWAISWVDAVAVSVLRIFIMGLLFGNPVSIWFSLGGGLFSLISLAILKKWCDGRFSFVGASIISAASHNVGQVIFATVFFGVNIVTSYLPVLLIASVVFGGLCGALVNFVYPKIQRIKELK
ncbi:MAG: Gx transporter family protein [Clostridia bacterium]|nr:Gx transporter family protein [Clostridia bacterium]